MPLLPLDLLLTVGSAAAVFVLGLVVWSRNKWATGSVLYGLCALSLSLWTSSDWFLSMQTTALPFQVFLWKLLFNISVCFGPAIAMHIAAFISHRKFQRDVPLIYILGIVSGATLVSGLLAPLIGEVSSIANPLMIGGAALAFIGYVGAGFFVASQLYPLIFSTSISTLERRRAAYGIILLLLFILSGSLQLVVGPLPTGLVLPALTVSFLVLSLAAFVRASFLDVELASLEPFLLFLTAFAVVLMLRSHDLSDAVITIIGFVAVAAFGAMAVKAVSSEKQKRILLEQTNRDLKVLEEAKGDFVDMVAHQLRTPLGGIRASSAMLVEGDYGALPEKARTAVALIEDAATRLLSLADTFLSMSRVEVGMYKTRRSEADIRKEVSNVIDEMSVSARSKQLALESSVDDDVPGTVRVDKDALRNALFNLIDNAIKYTDKGEVSVSVHVSDSLLIAEVRDTGFGMTSEELRDLFKKFHRGDVGRSHAMDGTGLGLYVVRRLIEAAGGRISAASEGTGKGSVFTVTLPIDPV